MNSQKTFLSTVAILLVEAILGAITGAETWTLNGVLLTTLGVGMGVYAIRHTVGPWKLGMIVLAASTIIWGLLILIPSASAMTMNQAPAKAATELLSPNWYVAFAFLGVLIVLAGCFQLLESSKRDFLGATLISLGSAIAVGCAQKGFGLDVGWGYWIGPAFIALGLVSCMITIREEPVSIIFWFAFSMSIMAAGLIILLQWGFPEKALLVSQAGFLWGPKGFPRSSKSPRTKSPQKGDVGGHTHTHTSKPVTHRWLFLMTILLFVILCGFVIFSMNT